MVVRRVHNLRSYKSNLQLKQTELQYILQKSKENLMSTKYNMARVLCFTQDIKEALQFHPFFQFLQRKKKQICDSKQKTENVYPFYTQSTARLETGKFFYISFLFNFLLFFKSGEEEEAKGLHCKQGGTYKHSFLNSLDQIRL